MGWDVQDELLVGPRRERRDGADAEEVMVGNIGCWVTFLRGRRFGFFAVVAGGVGAGVVCWVEIPAQ